MEESGAFVTKQLNRKVLELRVDNFINLIIATEEDNNRTKIFKKIKKLLKFENTEDEKFDFSFGKSLLKSTENLTVVLSNITGMLSGSNILGKALGEFAQKIVGQISNL